MLMSFLRSFPGMHLPRALRQLEQDVETVINVLQPGPVGIIEHKFSAAEVELARTKVKRAVENWKRNSLLEKSGQMGQFHSNDKSSKRDGV